MWVDEEAPSFNGVDHSSVDGLDLSAAEGQRRLLSAASGGDAAAMSETAMDVDLTDATAASNGAAKTTAIAGLTAAAAGLSIFFTLRILGNYISINIYLCM